MEEIKSAIKNWRYYVLIVLCMVAIIGILSVPICDHWFIALVVSKVIGFAAAAVAVKLCLQWLKAGKLPELEQLRKSDN